MGTSKGATFTFHAIENDTVVGTRTSGTMAYQAAVVTGTDENASARTWHLTTAAAQKEAVKVGGRAVPVYPVKVNGTPRSDQTMPNSDELATVGKARLKAAQDAVDAHDTGYDDISSAVDAEARFDERDVTGGGRYPADAQANREMFKGLGWSVTEPEVTVDEPVSEVGTDGTVHISEVLPAAKEAYVAEKAAAKKAGAKSVGGKKVKGAKLVVTDEIKAAAKPAHITERERKQALGRQVHEAVFAALDSFELPEGLDSAEAKDIITKWLSYIPTGQK